MFKLSTPIALITPSRAYGLRFQVVSLRVVFAIVGAMLVDGPLPLVTAGGCEVTGAFPLFDAILNESKELLFGT
jgi:hypothetical protein